MSPMDEKKTRRGEKLPVRDTRNNNLTLYVGKGSAYGLSHNATEA